MFGGISGGCFNPAIGVALTITGNSNYKSLWIYLIGPLAGGLLAGLFNLAHANYIEKFY